MASETRVQSQVRLNTARFAALRWGQAPVFFVAFIVSGALWGTGHNLPSVGTVAGAHTDFRTGVAWLAVVCGLLALASPLIGVAVGLIHGRWPSRLGMRWLVRGSVAIQTRRRTRLAGRLRELYPGQDPALRVALRFPTSAAVQPTALGNAEAAVADRVFRRYSLDLGLVWPLLAELIPEESRGPLAAAERRADVALYSTAGWLVATVFPAPFIWLLASFGMDSQSRMLIPVFALATAALTLIMSATRYRNAVDRTVAHGRLVESAVDKYRLALLDTLGMRRPAPDKERQYFALLPILLAGGEVDDRFRRTEAVADAQAAGVDMRDAVLRVIQESVSTEVPQAVSASVREAIDQKFAGPKLDNFDGHLSAAVIDMGDERILRGDDKSEVTLVPGRQYQLVITVGRALQVDGISVPVRVRGGAERPVVPFTLSIDSNVPALSLSERPFPVAGDQDARLDVPVRLEAGGPASAWLWIRVSQYGRTIQSMDITFRAANEAA